MKSQCSYCREEGLTEAQCIRGDCHDGCGDCASAAQAYRDEQQAEYDQMWPIPDDVQAREF